MPQSEARRLFLALWPEPAVRDTLLSVQSKLPPGTGRAVSGDNLHLTLAFLGTTPVEQQQCLEAALSEVRANGFTLCLGPLGYWRKPQVLWVGAEVMPPALASLVQKLRASVIRCGGVVDERPFQIHLTLFRKVRKSPHSLPTINPISWPIKAFVLVESVTASAGVQYRVLREWPLADDGASA